MLAEIQAKLSLSDPENFSVQCDLMMLDGPEPLSDGLHAST